MDYEVIGAAVAVVAALLWIRRDMRHDIAAIRVDLTDLRRDLTGQIGSLDNRLTVQISAVNTRIDNILLERRPQTPA